MKKSFWNLTTVMGWIYDHDLSIKVAGENSKNPGVEFINGTLSIATDNDCMNVVPVHFTYVTEMTSNNKTNTSFIVLKKIIDGEYNTVMRDGKENATRINVNSAIDLNEWFNADGNLVSTKRNEGGFIHINPIDWTDDENKRNTFKVDILINGFKRIEANEDRGTPERGVLKGAIFNFRKELLPVEFTVTNEEAMDYFESLVEGAAGQPVFTIVQGNMISQTVIRKITEESAFGEPIVRETRSSYKDYVVNWANPSPYDFDNEDTLLASELSEMIQQREIRKAEIKQRADEYQASKGKKVAIPANKGYNF